LLLERDIEVGRDRASEDEEGWALVPNLQYEGRKRDIPEYIQISMKKPRQNTIRSDHFFF
jgi:hypothetical protein